ncbi:MAG: hypothetical protein KAU16_08275 [Methanophagales archaeon]|nr:hypothetical protein [Methanophagales archaeon]
MGAKEIVEKIKDEANAECEKIMSEAKENAERIIKEAREEIELQKKNFIEAEERKGVEEKERIVRAARLNARKLRWDAEEEMIGKALEKAMNRIREVRTGGFKGNSYSNILTGLIKDAALSIIAGSSASSELEVMLNEEDADASFVKTDMLKKISDEISVGGVNVRLSLSGERIKSAGGVIVRGKDGKIEVNNTFEQRIARFSTGLREEIVKKLFTK